MLALRAGIQTGWTRVPTLVLQNFFVAGLPGWNDARVFGSGGKRSE
uniref:Uncharacterized protein n=1 Tax=Candidatus Kentrum sp. UNK TaxID=2126344 RepID=A0A451A0A7_9GAMM|nr:MAG: hypothetical protein BECKUNK1418G_GA0071005_100717 [Candidatus Kentron sp. UNK]VFK68731.1 MAG: hypothetical protein BECKUNK1418H_GA0071006_100535 [Candidatus Kentron sp. UNK]